MSDTTAETKPADTQEVPASSTEETKQEPIAEKSEDVAPEGEASAAETTTAEPAEATTTSEEAPVATEDAQPEEAKEEEIEEPIEIPSGNGELVLVTGATGYVASHIVRALLETGEFRVRGTVRSLENNIKLDRLKAALENCKTSPEYVEADLTNAESWTEAVKGCDYVIHTASPFPSSEPKDASELIEPAKEGTLAVLKACSEAGTVRRVVLTSSCVAVFSGRSVDKKALTEDDWADLEKVTSAYDKSKTLSEQAAWDFMKELPEGSNMELAVVNPGLVTGPPLTEQDCTSVELVKQLMNRQYPLIPKISFPIVDVRDVALSHIRAMMIKQAAGHRHILSSSTAWLKDLANILSQEFNTKGFNIPTTQAPYVLLWIKSHFDESIKMLLPNFGKIYSFDNTRMKKILQVEPRELKDSLLEMAHCLINMGIVQKVEKPEKKSKKLTFRKKKESKDIEEGEEKKDEPEKIKEGSADGSAGNGEIVADPADIEEPKQEVIEEVKADEAAAEADKPAEEAGTVSSEEEIKEEKPDPESSKTKEKKEKKEKSKKEKKKGSFPFSFSFKRNKKPQVEKKEKAEEEEQAGASGEEGKAEDEAPKTEETPAEPAAEETPAPAAEEATTATVEETPAAAAEETPAAAAEETPAAAAEETPAAEEAATPSNEEKTTASDEKPSEAKEEEAPAETKPETTAE